jgi:Fic family protein
MNWKSLDLKKKRLDGLRPLKPELVRNLEEWFRVELTYTSNAIEGNTLTRQETAVVLEKGLTVGGRTVQEHLEATNHAKALDWLKERLAKPKPVLGEKEILHLHEIILKGIDDHNAGRYRNVMVRISGSTVILPNARKIPELMREFAAWLKSSMKLHPAEQAAEAHYRLVTIHPFVDGNGRTARLLMNLMLMQGGFPPAFIRTRERVAYLSGLEKAQLAGSSFLDPAHSKLAPRLGASAQRGGSKDDYEKLMATTIDRSLDIYLNAAKGKTPFKENQTDSHLLRIGVLAQKTGESVATLRHWTKEGLLSPADHTEKGYTLYEADAVEKVKRIRGKQSQRLSLREIKRDLENEK